MNRVLSLFVLLVTLVGGCTLGTRSEPRRLGEVCAAFEDCALGLICSHDGVCRAEGEYGTIKKNQTCNATSACRIDLVCDRSGTCVEPGGAGTAGRDEVCASDDDCQFAYSCQEPYGGGETVCKGIDPFGWIPEPCPEDDEDAEPVAYYRVPDGAPEADFYRMPFPADALVQDGRISLEGHPTPPFATLAEAFPDLEVIGDVVGRLIDEVETGTGGAFGPNQTTFFRFSQFPDTGTLNFGLPGNGTVGLVDITAYVDGIDPSDLPDRPDTEALQRLAETLHPFRYEIASRATPYICQNWMAMHPLDGRPFLPGHTYAAILSGGIRLDDGTLVTSDADFRLVVSDDEPSDARLTRAWETLAPLRAYLADRAVDPTSLTSATVFTVQDTTARPQAIHQAVQNADAPGFAAGEPVVVCDGGSDPFADPNDPTRGCVGGGADHTEIQGIVGLPQFQQGTPPFKDAEDGGAIDTSSGPPSVVRIEDVHVAMTIPDGEMPADGWPLVLYGHGTGGNYTSFLRNGFADDHTTLTVDDTTVQVAMMSFDAPLHGPRRAEENWKDAWLELDPSAYDPDILFFNPLNLAAARDNALQQAADLSALVRFASTLELSDEDSPTGEAIRFDTERIYYVGHSQGGVAGVTFAAYEPALSAVVLSGAGGLTIQALLEKKNPNDIPAALRVGLVDVDISRVHPILNLGQSLAEASDGVNHARWLMRNPLEGHTAKHVLQSYGIGDTFTPDSTQIALARALGMSQFPNGNTPLDTNRYPVETPPVTGNGPRGATALMVHYAPPGDEDAHFVIFDRDDAKAHISSFLGTAVLDGVPTVAPAP